MSPSKQRVPPTRPAKLSMPVLDAVRPRPRLFDILDNSSKRPIIWIGAPAGSGKTTLAASWIQARKLSCVWYQVDAGDADLASFFYYMAQAIGLAAPRYKKPLPLLTTEHLQGIGVFSRRYFEESFRRLKSPAVIVFDNYQEAGTHSGFDEMIANLAETIPAGVNVVVLTRSGLPPTLARLRANNKIDLLGWDDMRFTLPESRELLEAEGMVGMSDAELAARHAKIDGWAAGLVFLSADATTARSEPHDLTRMQANGLFDYFASELFDKADPSTQQFLLATALLPGITASTARDLTGRADAEEILDRLSAHHYFTQKHAAGKPLYKYHSLFRDFLLARFRRHFSDAERHRLVHAAAESMLTAGRVDEAATLLLAHAHWDALIPLILGEAEALVTQGRSRTLEGWIAAVPETMRNANPWLLYWHGTCRLAFNPIESRALLEAAYALFLTQGEAAGTHLAWAGIIDTFVFAWSEFQGIDRWIDEFARLRTRWPEFPSPELEARMTAGIFNALLWRRPQDPQLRRWADRLGQFVLGNFDPQTRVLVGHGLVLYEIWLGDFTKATLIVEALRPAGRALVKDSLALQAWWVMETMYLWHIADHDGCLKAVAEGARHAEGTGIHLLDFHLYGKGVYSALSQEDTNTAAEFLQRMAALTTPRLIDIAYYHYTVAADAWYRDALPLSLAHANTALQVILQTGTPFPEAFARIELAITLFDLQQQAEAWQELKAAAVLSRGLTHLEFLCNVFGAWFSLQQHAGERCKAFLSAAFAAGARQNYVNFVRWRPDIMSQLCLFALEHDIEPEYARHLISYRGLLPPLERVLGSEVWPWPIRIQTLGRFEVTVHGLPLTLAGSTQQKPLALLKLLIALGGKAVAEEQVMDALWPDADGDRARQSLKTTLHRLRKSFGAGEVVVVKGGVLTLDAHRVWVDAWALDRVLDALEPAILAGCSSAIGTLMAQAIAANGGPFLAAEIEPLILTYRERLRARFLRLTGEAAEHVARDNPSAAIPIFEKALEVEPLGEGFYQGLMRVYRALDRKAEGITLYRRCRDVLKRELDVAPSATTEALGKALQNG